jgi:hypothetical protein
MAVMLSRRFLKGGGKEKFHQYSTPPSPTGLKWGLTSGRSPSSNCSFNGLGWTEVAPRRCCARTRLVSERRRFAWKPGARNFEAGAGLSVQLSILLSRNIIHGNLKFGGMGRGRNDTVGYQHLPLNSGFMSHGSSDICMCGTIEAEKSISHQLKRSWPESSPQLDVASVRGGSSRARVETGSQDPKSAPTFPGLPSIFLGKGTEESCRHYLIRLPITHVGCRRRRSSNPAFCCFSPPHVENDLPSYYPFSRELIYLERDGNDEIWRLKNFYGLAGRFIRLEGGRDAEPQSLGAGTCGSQSRSTIPIG